MLQSGEDGLAGIKQMPVLCGLLVVTPRHLITALHREVQILDPFYK